MAARGSMTERWQQILRLMDEAYADYLTGMAALRERVVVDLKRKLSDSQVLDPPRLEQSSAPSACEWRPTSRLTFTHAAGCGRERRRSHPVAPSQRCRRAGGSG